MVGDEKYAVRLAEHLGEPIDAACQISEVGTTGRIMRAAMVNGALIEPRAGLVSPGSKGQPSDIQIGQVAWLGLGSDEFSITKASSWIGGPKGSPVGRFAYAQVTGTSATEGKVTLRVDLDLTDGRHLAFEARRVGINRPNVAVVELLRSRCSAIGFSRR